MILVTMEKFKNSILQYYVFEPKVVVEIADLSSLVQFTIWVVSKMSKNVKFPESEITYLLMGYIYQ